MVLSFFYESKKIVLKRMASKNVKVDEKTNLWTVKINNWLSLWDSDVFEEFWCCHGDGEVVGHCEAIGAPKPTVVIVKWQILSWGDNNNVYLDWNFIYRYPIKV